MDFSKHGQGTTSVVVHSAPGGKSSIQLGGGYGVDKEEKPIAGKIGSGAATVPTVTKPEEEEEKKDEETKQEQQAQPVVAAGARPGGAAATTSTVVRQPPGGKSSGLW